MRASLLWYNTQLFLSLMMMILVILMRAFWHAHPRSRRRLCLGVCVLGVLHLCYSLGYKLHALAPAPGRMRRSGPIGLFPLAANLKSRRGGFDYTGLFSMIFAGGESFFPTVKIIYKLFRGRVERLRRTRRKSRFCCAAKVLLFLLSHHLILTPPRFGFV